MKGYTFWLTGLSGSGKTTIAEGLAKILRQHDIPVVLVDGDIIRKVLSSDLGFTLTERQEQARRMANICKLIGDSDILNIACNISSSKQERDYVRGLIKNSVVVYIKCPLQVCMERDPKGYYHQLKLGKLKNFVGADIKYNEPNSPDITLDTDNETIDESISKLYDFLMNYEMLHQLL